MNGLQSWLYTADTTTDEADLTPCRRDPARWDTEQTRVDGIRAAALDCETLCPLIEACRARVADLRAMSRTRNGSVAALAGMVWAGEAYNHLGTRLDLLDEGVRTGPRRERDTRHVTEDGRVFDGHVGTWVWDPAIRPDRAAE